MNTNFQTIHQMGNAVSEMVRQATGRNPVQSMDMDWVTVEQMKKWIYGEKSGDIVSFVTNLRNGITKLSASINPVQNMHGYSTPWPGGTGANKFPDFTEPVTQSGITITPNADGSFTVTGTNGGSANYFDLTTEFDSSAYAGYVFSVVQSGQAWGSSSVGVRISASQADRTSIQSLASGDTIEDNGTGLCLAFRVAGNYELPEGGVTYKLMLASAEYTGDFVPYRNVCPISGWNMCNVFVTGKNLLNPDEFTEGYYINDSGVMTESQYGTVSGLIPAKVGKIYALSGKATENSAGYRSVTGYDSEGNFVQQWKLNGMAPAGAGYGVVVNNTNPLIKMFRITFFKDVDINVQFEITTSMETAYEEFTGNTYTAIWSNEDPGIVYMGSVDVINGILTVNTALVTYDGSEDENWQIQGGTYKYGSIPVSDLDYDNRENSISDTFVYASVGNSNSNIGFGFVSTNDLRIRKALDTSLTVSDFKQYLSLNPVKILYPIKTPVTYQLDPNTVESIIGTNYVMADTGTVSVEYRHEEEMP